MNLELAYFSINDLRFGEKTQVRDSVLFINRDELKSYLLNDNNFSDVEISITHPGEMTRIINVLDIIDPRKKTSEGSDVFPGLVGGLAPVGFGRTNILSNVAIIETGRRDEFMRGILDMGGEGSKYSPYAKTHNIVLSPVPSHELTAYSYAKSLKLAGLKTSIYLGKNASNMNPTEVRTVAFGGNDNIKKGLPRVGYIWQVLSHYDLRGIYYYGNRCYNFYPLLISPNEIFDGAVVSGHYDHSPALKNYTHTIVNNPVVMELCRRDGKELNFAGIVLTNEPKSVEEKMRNALMNAIAARTNLNLDGVVITKEGGGHTDIDIMETCKQCEKLGIKTAIIDIEMLNPQGEGDYPLVVFEPEADAVVSAGNVEERVRLPKVDRVLGGQNISNHEELSGSEIEITLGQVSGAISQIGMSKMRGLPF